MNIPIEVELGEDSVRFTYDGMIFIEDAIKALMEEEDDKGSDVWKKMKEEHPGILDYCGSHVTNEGDLIQTIDIEGLEKLFQLLPKYMQLRHG
jgi:hypothetical protein